jgi:hypothetical protein
MAAKRLVLPHHFAWANVHSALWQRQSVTWQCQSARWQRRFATCQCQSATWQCQSARWQRQFATCQRRLATCQRRFATWQCQSATWQCQSAMEHLQSAMGQIDVATGQIHFARRPSGGQRSPGRLVDWREKFWSRRYRAIPVSGEEGAQRERLKYVLSHGAKEGLVGDLRQWPGVHAIRPLLDDEPVQGIWFDRTQEYAARRRGEEFERLRFTTPYSVRLSPLPCWEDLPEEIKDNASPRSRRRSPPKRRPGSRRKGLPRWERTPFGARILTSAPRRPRSPRRRSSTPRPNGSGTISSTPTTPSSPPSARRRRS